nr:MAG TPA: hypothetical protein [Caudoviricetes sp.]
MRPARRPSLYDCLPSFLQTWRISNSLQKSIGRIAHCLILLYNIIYIRGGLKNNNK